MVMSDFDIITNVIVSAYFLIFQISMNVKWETIPVQVVPVLTLRDHILVKVPVGIQIAHVFLDPPSNCPIVKDIRSLVVFGSADSISPQRKEQSSKLTSLQYLCPHHPTVRITSKSSMVTHQILW